MIRNGYGITIKELKDYVKDLPEKNENGDDFTVWMATGEGLSSQVKEIWQLNAGDIIIDL